MCEVRRIALLLPNALGSDDRLGFSVSNGGKQKSFTWTWLERVHPKRVRVPNHEVIAVRVVDLDEKDVLIAAEPGVFFTEPHYNGFPAVLVRLDAIDTDELEELIIEAWRCQAPRALVQEFDQRSGT